MSRIILLSILISFLPTAVKSQCNHPDFAGLMELYNSTDGPNWTKKNGWKEGAEGNNCDPCGGWHGVTCNADGRVTLIILRNNNMTGSIANINVEKLQILDLGNNQLIQIPDFTNIPELIFLFLSNNKINSIPDFSNLPKLQRLSINSNLLTTIPDFANLPELQQLFCYENQIKTLPDFTNTPKLNWLNCFRNQLITLPDFSNLPLLNRLDCNENQITSVPDFSNLPMLQALTLSQNQLKSIPDFSNLPSLVSLAVGKNQISGNLPELQNSPLINTLTLSDNFFTGCIPEHYCDIISVNLRNNPKLPYSGEMNQFCMNGKISIGANCDDGLVTTIEDHILENCICLGSTLDTFLVTVYDTIQVKDTITFTVIDTVTVRDTITQLISVTDTLIIDLNIPNSTGGPLHNRIILYPNPASTHLFIDFGDHALMENYTCQIINDLGQNIFFTPIDQKLYYLDLNTWGRKGTYFIKIINDFGQTVETKKIILQ